MLKTAKYLWICACILVLFCIGGLLADKQMLCNDLIRLHVVANSDSEIDQQRKLSVRDAITGYIDENLPKDISADAAKQHLNGMLVELEKVSKETLRALGCRDDVKISLTQESFGRRDYETFALPSGIYESLRVEIGKGEGKNWWCVIFPSLCIPTTSETFVNAAVTDGMDQGLANTLSGESGYEVRFYLLDLIGKIENFFYFG